MRICGKQRLRVPPSPHTPLAPLDAPTDAPHPRLRLTHLSVLHQMGVPPWCPSTRARREMALSSCIISASDSVTPFDRSSRLEQRTDNFRRVCAPHRAACPQVVPTGSQVKGKCPVDTSPDAAKRTTLGTAVFRSIFVPEFAAAASAAARRISAAPAAACPSKCATATVHRCTAWPTSPQSGSRTSPCSMPTACESPI